MAELSLKLGRMLGMHQLVVWDWIAVSCALVLAFLACWLLMWFVSRLLDLTSPRRGASLYLALWTFATGFAAPFAYFHLNYSGG